MSTKAIIHVTDECDTLHIYRHWDGMPKEVVRDIRTALQGTVPAMFEAGEAAPQMIAVMKPTTRKRVERGGIYLTTQPDMTNHEFEYTVRADRQGIWIDVYEHGQGGYTLPLNEEG